MKKRHNRLSALLLSIFMCISTITLPVYAQDAGTEAPIPEQEPETEVIVSEEEPAETEEEAGEPEEETEEITVSEPEEPLIEEEPEPAPEEPAEVQEAEEEETDSSVFADETWTLKLDLNADDATFEGQELEITHNLSDYLYLPYEEPKRQGYSFAYWAVDKDADPDDYDGDWYYSGGSIEPSKYPAAGETLTLYAIWRPTKLFMLIYHFNTEGGTFSWLDEPEDPHVARGTWYKGGGYFDDATAPGKVFLGWALDPNAGESDIVQAEDITRDYWDTPEVELWGVWRDAETYTVTYNANGGVFADKTDTITHSVLEGEYGNLKEAVINDRPTRDGYRFAGWMVDSNSSIKYSGDSIQTSDADSSRNIVLNAQWEEGNPFKITFHVDSDVTIEGDGVVKVSDTEYTAPFSTIDVDRSLALPNEEGYTYPQLWVISKKGYDLNGWSTDESRSGDKYFTLTRDMFGDQGIHDIEVWDNWSESLCFVYYHTIIDGAAAIGGDLSQNSFVPKNYRASDEVKIDVKMIHPDYIFKGWALTWEDALAGHVDYRYGDVLGKYFRDNDTNTLSLYAVWHSKKFKVYYYPTISGVKDGSYTLSANEPFPVEFEQNDKVVINHTYTHMFKAFKGWALTEEDALNGNVKYKNGQDLGKYFAKNLDDLSLYAVWENDTAAKYVHYDPIYDDVTDIDGQLSAAGWFTQKFYKSDVVTVNQECIREGYVLKGWNTDRAKAEAGIVQYRNGQSLGKYFAKGADNLILYAVWRDDTIGGEVIYYPAIDGALREDGTEILSHQYEKVQFDEDEDVEINMTFTHPDFTLQGWATSEANADKGIIAYSNKDKLTKYFADHDDNLVLYAVWKQDFGTVIYHPNRSGAAPVDRWLSQSGYQAKSFRRDENVIIDQEMIHPSYILQGWATTKKKADAGTVEYRNGDDLGKYFADKDELVLYGVWKAGKGLITSVTIPEQTIYENWNASEDASSYSPDYTSYDLTPSNITVKADGKTYKGTPEEVAADIEEDINVDKGDDEKTEVNVDVRDNYVSAEYMPKTAKLKIGGTEIVDDKEIPFGGIETSFKIKFVKDPVTVTIPDGAKIFMDDLDENEEYNFLPEKMTVKIGKKTYTGDFDTVAGRLETAQKMGMNISEWENWDRTQHAIELHSEKYAGRGRGFAMYPYSTEFIEGPIASITADDIYIQAAGDYSVFYNTHGNLVEGSVTKDRLVDAVYMTVTLKDGSTIEGQLADINKRLDEKYGSHYRNARLEGTGTTRRLVLGNCDTMLDVSEPQFTAKEKVAVGKSITLKPETSIKKPMWTAVETTVAKVTSKGKVTGVKEGVTMVYVVDKTTGMQMGHWYVEIVPAANVVDISYRGTDDNYHGSVSGRTLKLDEDGFALKSAVYPENAIQEVTWTSSNNKIATIAEDGAVTRHKNGTVTFTAKAKDGTGKKASVKVTFATFVEDLQITGPAEVAAGKKVTLKTVATGINGKTPTNKAVTWKSSDPSIAKITSKGVVTAVKGKEGQSVTITAIAKDREGRVDEVVQTFTLNVTAPVTSVKLKDPAGEYINGKTVKVSGSSYTITPEVLGNPGNELKWTSAKTSVAEVDQNGVVTKKKNGTVKITAAATDGTGKKATVTLKFTD